MVTLHNDSKKNRDSNVVFIQK